MIRTVTCAWVLESRSVTVWPALSPSTRAAVAGRQAGTGVCAWLCVAPAARAARGQRPVTGTIRAATAGSATSWVCSFAAAVCPGRFSTSDSGLTRNRGRRSGSRPPILLAMSEPIRWMLPREAAAVIPMAEPGRPLSSLVAAPAVTALKKDTAAAVKVAVVSAVRMTTQKATRCAITCLIGGGGLRNTLLLLALLLHAHARMAKMKEPRGGDLTKLDCDTRVTNVRQPVTSRARSALADLGPPASRRSGCCPRDAAGERPPRRGRRGA